MSWKTKGLNQGGRAYNGEMRASDEKAIGDSWEYVEIVKEPMGQEGSFTLLLENCKDIWRQESKNN